MNYFSQLIWKVILKLYFMENIGLQFVLNLSFSVFIGFSPSPHHPSLVSLKKFIVSFIWNLLVCCRQFYLSLRWHAVLLVVAKRQWEGNQTTTSFSWLIFPFFTVKAENKMKSTDKFSFCLFKYFFKVPVG